MAPSAARTATSVSVALVLASTLMTSSASAGPWENVGNLDGVHVWRREEPGSSMKSFRGELVAPVHIAKLVAVLVDRDQRQFWVDRYGASTLLEKPGPLSEVYWIRFKLPALISDRDYVLRSDAEVDAKRRVFTVNIKSVEGRKGEESCCVRATVNRTFYRFTALKPVKGVPYTRLEVEVNTDPKGLLPSWLVNMIQKEWPSKTLNGLVRQTQTSKTAPMPELAGWHD